MAGLVVLVVGLIVAAIRWSSPSDAPLADPTAAVSSAASSSVVSSTSVPSISASVPTVPEASASGRAAAKHGAIAKVPRAVILRQLARAAERIAQHMPMPTAPADLSANQTLGYNLMIQFGFPADQWPYLNALWIRESGWNHLAENRSSGAYGIPQSLPATKMAVVGPDWRTNPETQIKWGLAYIAARYGTPQGAWAHETRIGWY